MLCARGASSLLQAARRRLVKITSYLQSLFRMGRGDPRSRTDHWSPSKLNRTGLRRTHSLTRQLECKGISIPRESNPKCAVSSVVRFVHSFRWIGLRLTSWLLNYRKDAHVGRRGIDVSQRKDFVAVSETMATIMHDNLKEFSFSKHFRMSE